jgi:hypothetical protein
MAIPTKFRRPKLAEIVLLGAAFVWAILLFVAACTLPWHSEISSGVTLDPQTQTVTTTATNTSSTLIESNGPGAYFVVSIPLVVVVLVALLVFLRDPLRGTNPLAWVVLGLLGAFNLLAMLSVGVFILPITGCLLAVCMIRTHRRASTSPPVATMHVTS